MDRFEVCVVRLMRFCGQTGAAYVRGQGDPFVLGQGRFSGSFGELIQPSLSAERVSAC